MLHTGKMAQIRLGMTIKKFSRFRLPYLEIEKHYRIKHGVIYYTEEGIERLREVSFKLDRIKDTIDDIYTFYGKNKNDKPTREKNIIKNVIISHLEDLETPREIISYLLGLKTKSYCYAKKSLARLKRDRFSRIMIMDVKEIVKINIKGIDV